MHARSTDNTAQHSTAAVETSLARSLADAPHRTAPHRTAPHRPHREPTTQQQSRTEGAKATIFNTV
jgi:hypothetical protein